MSQIDKPESSGKPFDIPKMLIWEAYQKVRANKGAAGVDEQSLTDFARDEKKNLYKSGIGSHREVTSRRR